MAIEGSVEASPGPGMSRRSLSLLYVTSEARSLFLENYEYSTFDLREDDRVQIGVISSLMRGQILAGDTPAQLIENSPALALLVKESECSACGASYVDCQCSKLLDEDMAQRITDACDAFVFWTDQPLTRSE